MGNTRALMRCTVPLTTAWMSLSRRGRFSVYGCYATGCMRACAPEQSHDDPAPNVGASDWMCVLLL